MKKILIGLLLIISLFALNVHAVEVPEITDHEKVTLYVFRGSGCSHCYEALTWLGKTAYKYKDIFEVKAYEVWYNQANSELMKSVATTLGKSATGVPFIVVGDYSIAGFANSISEEILTEVFNAYKDERYVDVVQTVAKSHSDIKAETLKEACKEEGIRVVEKESTVSDGVSLAIIFVVIVGGILGLYALSRRSKKA